MNSIKIYMLTIAILLAVPVISTAGEVSFAVTTQEDFQQGWDTGNVTLTQDSGAVQLWYPAWVSDNALANNGGGTWAYRMPVYFWNNSVETYSDSGCTFTVNTQSLVSAGKMQADGDDIRFFQVYNADTGGVCPYIIASGINTVTTEIMIKVPLVPANDTAVLYMYYGNPDAGSVDEDNMFTTVLSDDFNDNSLDANLWYDASPGSAYVSEASEKVTMNYQQATYRAALRTKDMMPTANIEVLFKAKHNGTTTHKMVMIHATTLNPAYGHGMPETHYKFDEYKWDGNHYISKAINQSGGLLTSTTLGVDYSWHDYEFRYLNGNLRVMKDDAKILDTNDSDVLAGRYVFFSCRERDANTDYDDITIRSCPDAIAAERTLGEEQEK